MCTKYTDFFIKFYLYFYFHRILRMSTVLFPITSSRAILLEIHRLRFKLRRVTCRGGSRPVENHPTVVVATDYTNVKLFCSCRYPSAVVGGYEGKYTHTQTANRVKIIPFYFWRKQRV